MTLTVLEALNGATLLGSLNKGTPPSPLISQAEGDGRYGRYEAGTWTPTLSFGGASTGITYGPSNSGHYRKIGQIVFLCGALQLTSKGTSTGDAAISGIPFSSNPGSGSGVSGTFQNATMNFTGVQVPFLTISASDTVMRLRYWPGQGQALFMNDTHFNNNTQINFTIWYLAGS